MPPTPSRRSQPSSPPASIRRATRCDHPESPSKPRRPPRQPATHGDQPPPSSIPRRPTPAGQPASATNPIPSSNPRAPNPAGQQSAAGDPSRQPHRGGQPTPATAPRRATHAGNRTAARNPRRKANRGAQPQPPSEAKAQRGVRVAEPPLAASEALPHKRRRRPGPRSPRTRVAYRLRGRYWDRTSDLFRVREARYRCANRPTLLKPVVEKGFEVETGFEPVYTALQAVASPLGHSTSEKKAGPPNPLRADDRVRTGDLNLGKVALYQLSYVRIATGFSFPRREKNISPSPPEFKNRGRPLVDVRSSTGHLRTARSARIALALR